MGKDLKVEGDLKVKDDLHVCGYAKIEHHLSVDGHLDFGQGLYAQQTSNITTVPVTTASGIITTQASVIVGLTTSTFTVTSSKVKANSVVLLSVMSSVPVGVTTLTLAAYNVVDGSFTLAVNVAGVPTGTPLKIGYLIC